MLSRKLSFVLAVALISCTNYLKDPHQIIDKTVEGSGGKKFTTSKLTFDIGENHFEVKGTERSIHDTTIAVVFLPFLLADSLVDAKYLGDTMIEGKIFYTIEIKNPQGNIRFWINRDDFTIGYIAYSFHDSPTGLRFCKAVNPRRVDQIRFYDYVIHKPKNNETEINDLELLFTKGDLVELNKVEVQNIKVR